jgi:L-fuculose-phosphate aldolase
LATASPRPSGASTILKNRPEIDVVIHTHSMFCTTLAIHGRSIPAVHYMVAAAGGNDIRCAPYVTPTTRALSDVALERSKGAAPACWRTTAPS